MREIRFRAWDKKHKEMINDIWIAPHYNWGVYSDNDCMGQREVVERDQVVLMQYTGLKDSKGVDIYEGDIIRSGPFTWHSSAPVVWFGHEARFGIEADEDEDPVLLNAYHASNNYEFLGNIYDHPDLLQDKGEE